MRRLVGGLVVAVLTSGPVLAQPAPAKPPAVGVVTVLRKPVTQSKEYVGRIQATDRVNLVARVAAFLEQRYFTEGAEVRKGDLLYRLEQAPFLADVQAKQAAIAQFKALLQNAVVTLSRARTLLTTPAGLQSNVDTAVANEQSLRAQVLGAEAQLQQAQINLGYTEIRAPIDGKIGRTAVTTGNYVSAGSGVLATIVSQDPMYVVFAVSSRTVVDLRRPAPGQADAGPVVIKIRLPDGSLYDHTGSLDFVDNTVGGNTDTITLRGTVGNPLADAKRSGTARELVDGEFVTVILEDARPIDAMAIPRSAVLSDQGGDYVYVVDRDEKAQQRRIRLGPSSPSSAAVTSGLSEGESVIVEGIQRVRPGQPVSAAPASEASLPPPGPPADSPVTSAPPTRG